MIVPGSANPLLLGDAGYKIQRSLRFRSSASAYLSRTPASAGNQQKWTYSVWLKRGKLGVLQKFLEIGNNASNYITLMFTGPGSGTVDDRLNLYANSGGVQALWLDAIPVYRDTSAWYHIVLKVDTTDASAGNRIMLYVNGTQIFNFATATYPAQNANLFANGSGISHSIGANPSVGGNQYFDGYLAEVNFIDGQALTPSSFGQTDPVTGVWTPKKYIGTYGTNGFYLPFSDNTSATTLAYDKSGNGNNWTANNISTTAGVTYDSMLDVPTLTSATAANYCTWNPLRPNAAMSYSNGNLSATSNGGSGRSSFGTFGMPSGKWYFELTGVDNSCGIATVDESVYAYYQASGSYLVNGSTTSGKSTYTTTDIIGCAYDANANTIEWFKNNVSQGLISFSSASGQPVVPVFNGTASVTRTCVMNCGAGSGFAYTPPTGFKALNTFNLPDPTIKKPNQYMDATTYTGNGVDDRNITGTNFAPDFVWIKQRSGVNQHELYDTVRGATKRLMSNDTAAEDTAVNNLQAFLSNGFQVGTAGSINANGATYVGWQWKKGATPGFDIVTFNSTVAAQTVSHSLGIAPSMIILKNRAVADGWYVYHKSLSATEGLYLHLTNAKSTGVIWWNSAAPTASVFSVNMGNTNAHVAYLFAEIAGFSKFGSYTGNGATGEPNADGPFVFCGFRPRYLMVKRSDSTGDWNILDAARNTLNVAGSGIYANLSAAEGAGDYVDFLSNGFKIRDSGTGFNTNAGTYIYAAFAENPLKYSLAR